MRSPRRDRSLLGRVTLAATLAAVGGALVAAASAAFVADRAIARAEERRLRDQGGAILAELAALPPHQVALEIADEARELQAVGLRIAVFDRGARVGGDRELRSDPGGCAIVGEMRTCTVESGPWTCTVAARALIGERFRTFGIAAAVAVATAFLIGLALNRRMARWAVAPLARLARRVSATPQPDLGPDEGVREVDELRGALAESYTNLSVALSTARRFSADAAHELRTPLTTLCGELELIEEQLGDPALRADLRRARATAGKLAELTERLLLLARSPDRLPGGDAVVLAEVVARVVARVDARDRERLAVDANPASVVRGDEPLLASLVENAIHNAVAHGAGAIDVRVDATANSVILVVTDEGPGIAPGDRARVFEPFVRGANRGAVAGHGLGLALIAHVARAHGGAATFEEATRGAHLRVVLPAWTPRAT